LRDALLKDRVVRPVLQPISRQGYPEGLRSFAAQLVSIRFPQLVSELAGRHVHDRPAMSSAISSPWLFSVGVGLTFIDLKSFISCPKWDRREKFPMEFAYLRQFLPDDARNPCGNLQIKDHAITLGLADSTCTTAQKRNVFDFGTALAQDGDAFLGRAQNLGAGSTRAVPVLGLVRQKWLVDRTSRTHILPYPGCGTMRVLEERERTKWTIKKHKNFANDCWRSTKS
jgi:hypothetical protein